MNLARARVVLRPRTLAEVLDLACIVGFRDALGLILRLSALFLLPIYVLCLVLVFAFDAHWAIVWSVAAVLAAIVQGVFTVAAGRYLFAEEVGVREVVKAYRERLGSYMASLALSRLYLVLAASACLLPLAAVWPRMLYVHEASLLEMAGGVEATTRAKRFADRQPNVTLQVVAGLVAAQVACVFGAELLGDGIVSSVLQLGKPFGAIWTEGGTPYSLLGFLASVPYVAIARFLMYIDGRTRSDGWDVQLKFMALAAADAEARALP